MDLTDTSWIDSKEEEDHIRVKAIKLNKRMAGAPIIDPTELDDGLEVGFGLSSIVFQTDLFQSSYLAFPNPINVNEIKNNLGFSVKEKFEIQVHHDLLAVQQ